MDYEEEIITLQQNLHSLEMELNETKKRHNSLVDQIITLIEYKELKNQF